MYCKECGNQIADDSKFCANCGKSQNGNEVPITDKGIENTKQMVKRVEPRKLTTNSVWAWGIGIIIIICVIIGIIGAITDNKNVSDIINIPRLSNENNVSEKSNNLKVAEIKYEVTGTASSVDITLTNPQGGIEQFSNVKPPGSYKFSVPIKRGSLDYYHAMISAQNNGSRGNITVTIYVNGKKFRTATSSGAYVIASADGAVEYKDVRE